MNTQDSSFFSQHAQSRMSPFDEAALRQLLSGKKGLRILEIGSWLGAGSTRIFVEYADLVVCVDHWKGNENAEHKKLVELCDPYSVFQENTKSFSDKIVTIRSDSTVVGEVLTNRQFDFVFIDGDHRYSQTILDIRNCLPKVREGGMICGHDCEFRLSDLGRQFTLQESNSDHIDSPLPKFRHCHPGVVLAVDEIFGEDVNLFADEERKLLLEDGRIGYSSIWYKNLL